MTLHFDFLWAWTKAFFYSPWLVPLRGVDDPPRKPEPERASEWEPERKRGVVVELRRKGVM